MHELQPQDAAQVARTDARVIRLLRGRFFIHVREDHDVVVPNHSKRRPEDEFRPSPYINDAIRVFGETPGNLKPLCTEILCAVLVVAFFEHGLHSLLRDMHQRNVRDRLNCPVHEQEGTKSSWQTHSIVSHLA